MAVFSSFTFSLFAQRPLGIDVSHWQGSINWTSVKNDGIVFALAKATQGTSYVDPMFTSNESGAKNAGVLIGAYHFSQYDQNLGTAGATNEANHFWSVAQNYITGGGYYLMPVLDAEYIVITNVTHDPGDFGYTKATFSQWVNAWCNTVSNNAAAAGVTNIRPAIYCGVSFASTWLNSTVTNWIRWTANWNGQDPQTGGPSGNTPWPTWTIWQYADNTSVSGISGNVDGDVFNGTFADLVNKLVIGGTAVVPPYFVSQPSARHGDLGGYITMRVAADGSAPLGYLWRFKGNPISGATNSTYTISNIQTNNGGNYTVIVTNTSGSITSSAAKLTVNGLYTPVFVDLFDTNSASRWTVNKSSLDTRVTFNYNYAAMGIPSAPNSTGGTTRGAKFEANVSAGVVAALSMAPIGQSFIGDYRLHFDLWMNQNGPFPAGGTGSTQHGTAGLGTGGNGVQWNTNTADGVWFAIDGEGQATDTSATLPDVRAYVGGTLQATNSGVYTGGDEPNIRGNGHPYYQNVFPGGQAAPASQQSSYAQQTGGLAGGTIGFAWRDVVITKSSNTVEWYIDGLKIATVTNVTFTSSNVFIGYWDSFASLSDNTNLSFGVFDNVRVEVPVVAPVILTQPQSQTNNQGTNVTFIVAASGTPAPAYLWRFDGTNIANATASSFTRTNIQPSDAGSYSVVVTNIGGSVTSAVATLTVNVPPTIASHPQPQSVSYGSNALFAVTASGTAPLSYQWRFNGADIAGANSGNYTRSNVRLADAGDYSVAVSNLAGFTISSNALLSVIVPPFGFNSIALLTDGNVQMAFSGPPGTYSIESSSNLLSWQFLTSVTNESGSFEFTDLDATNHTANFYRAKLMP